MTGPGSGERRLLMVRHETRIEYEHTVAEAHTVVRKTPVPTGLQRVLTTSLRVSPETHVRQHPDYYGNVVTHFNVLGPHDTLEVVGESVVETTDGVCCGPEAKPDPRAPEERFAEFLHPSPRVPGIDAYETVPTSLAPGLGGDAFLEGLQALAAEFQARFRYDPWATHVDSGPGELFELGGGVCQDFSHAMIGVLRRAGIPARYASGYLYDPALDPGSSRAHSAAASHAWVQAWHAELGWVGADGTHGCLVDWQYVRTAVGRDYADVLPMKGFFLGTGSQRLSVAVVITRIDD